MTMTLRHLTIFLKVYQQQHITQAAEQLNLTQPTVSLAIKELETYYGIRLFERLGRGVAPTEAGRELYRYAVHITSLFDEMETRMRNWDSMGVLRVGSSITIGTHILPSLIQSFQTSFPGMQVEAHISNSGEIENRLLSNQIDVGLIESKPAHAELYSVPFLQDSLCALTAPDHPLATRPSVTLKDLADYPFLMREKGKQPFVHVTLHKNQRIGKTSKQTLVLLADGTSASFTMKNRYFRLEQGVRLWKKLFLKMT